MVHTAINGLDLGTCCVCEQPIVCTANNDPTPAMISLPFRAPIPGRGWGCFVCDLPNDGATAVLCGACALLYARGEVRLRFACRGFPATDGRVPIAQLTEPFLHGRLLHMAAAIV